MENTELEKISQQLINTALAGKHRKFELITNFKVLLSARLILKANKKIVNGFATVVNNLFDNYITNMTNGIDDLQLLIDAKSMITCTEFYQEECRILRRSISEYLAYLSNGGFIPALFGSRRRECEMFNYLTGEWIGSCDE